MSALEHEPEPVVTDSFHRSLDAAISRAEHIIRCASCKSENVVGSINGQGHWYGRCLTCGTRFWAR